MACAIALTPVLIAGAPAPVHRSPGLGAFALTVRIRACAAGAAPLRPALAVRRTTGT
jgi:hypothetical protein